MALTPEGKVKARVKEILKARGVWYCMPRGTTFGRSGIPDFVCCHMGRFFGIETKAGRGKATPLQLRELNDIVAHFGCALIVREANVEQVESLLDFIESNCNVNTYKGIEDEEDKRRPDTR